MPKGFRIKRRLITFKNPRERYDFPCIIQACNVSGLCNRLRAHVALGALVDAYDPAITPAWAYDVILTNIMHRETNRIE